MSVKVTGVKQVVTNFAKLDVRLRQRIQAAIREGTENVATKARQKVPRLTSELHDTIRTEYTAEGNAGFVKAGFGKLRRRSSAVTTGGKVRASRRPKSDGAGVYAMVIEYGSPHRGVSARPFMRPSLHAERSKHRARIESAINAAANDVARGAK